MIRSARFSDYNRVIEMLAHFADHAPLDLFHDADYDHQRLLHVLQQIQSNGCIIVAVDSTDTPQGMIIGRIVPDLWMPDLQFLRELAWWVEPTHRNTSMGYRLLCEYRDFGESLVDRGVTQGTVLTNMAQSPDFDLEKRGWQHIETNYIYSED